ncbi:unnamed protein product [Effrenium voratum]|uniref:Aspartyl/asparaginy/proline hydroxylase domain-containing protein n=1 Tax=Effrenium voratum TaxID=2562239 RepID=A0AA36IIN9_9DINO|nr:unnamed protein product [Effrenium voratum]CAJ1430042.1 unnamed protein product [Effrenium voratum]
MWDLRTATHNASLLDLPLQAALGELWLHNARATASDSSRKAALQRARGYLISALELGQVLEAREVADLHVALNRVLDMQGDLAACRHWAEKCVARQVLWENPWQRPGHFLRGLGASAWHAANCFELCRRLEAAYPQIKAELLSLGACWGRVGERAAHDGALVAAGEWNEVVLLGDSEECFGHRQKCPATSAVLAARPEAAHCAQLGVGEALFSRLKPGTRLRTHCGPTNMRLTCHLGLVIPEGCTITAGQETRTWEEGRCLVFDDSFEHSVENTSDQSRVILLVNFWHPAIPPTEWQQRAAGLA